LTVEATPSRGLAPASPALARDLSRRVRAEQRGRGEHGGRDRDALGDRLGGVADRVELGEDLRALLVDVAGHLGDALRVVETGPKVSIATMTPTVVSRPQPASATANSESAAPPPSRKAP
jgi:hypothetical protein